MQTSHESIVDDAQLLQRIRSALEDDNMTKDYKALLQSGPREFGRSLQEWNFENGLLLHRGKVYVPKDQELRLELLRLHHDTRLAGHQGRWKTLELISRNYWWPGMTIDVKKYVQGCDICQRNKPSRQPKFGLLQPNEVPAGLWETFTIDIITHLPESIDTYGNTRTAIVVVVDRFSKRAHFFADDDHVSAASIAILLYERIFPLHGIPRQIISDRGSQFASQIFKEFCQRLGIRSSMSTAYHPQTDGQTERVNQSLEQYLRIFSEHRPDDWAKLLSAAEFAYNNAAHESTGLSPFFIEHGWHPRMAPDVQEAFEHPTLEDIFQNRKEAREQAEASLKLAAERMKWYYDQHKQEVQFKVGDKVLIRGKDLRVKVSNDKLSAKNFGPYDIIEQLGPVTFRLRLPAQMHVHPVFHASKLIPYHADVIGNRNPSNPPPIEVEGYDEYEVEKILDSRVHQGWVQYLVKWLGYDESEATWEPLRNVRDHAQDIIREFHIQHPNAPQPISMSNPRPVDAHFNRAIYVSQELKPEEGVV